MSSRASSTSGVSASAAQPKGFARSPLVTIIVGPEKEKFFVHKDILTSKSEYFKARLSDKAPEGSTANSLQWTERYQTPEAVDAMVTWLYTGETGTILLYEDVLKCYKLATKYHIEGLKGALENYVEYSATNGSPVPFSSLASLRSLRLGNTPLYRDVCRLIINDLRSSRAKGKMSREERLRKRLNDESSESVVDVLIEELLREPEYVNGSSISSELRRLRGSTPSLESPSSYSPPSPHPSSRSVGT